LRRLEGIDRRIRVLAVQRDLSPYPRQPQRLYVFLMVS
jgi:hypothetical protein